MEKLPGHAFISYVREDSHDVDKLQRTLEAAGISVWRDTADLWPGEDWRAKIRRAITDNALVFIACFSSQSVARAKSYQNEELLLAVDQLRLRQPDDPWLIPVRFDHCDVPDFELGGGRTLASIQWVDLFGDRREAGYVRLVLTVLRILGQRPKAIRREQPASVPLKLKDAIAGWAAPPPRTGQGFGEQSYRPPAEPNDAAASTKMVEPLTLSGRNSKLLEVDLPPGRYRLRWKREGKGQFIIFDESERGGEGWNLLQILSTYPEDSGETVVRIKEEGRHLLNVKGNHQNWEFSFTPIISQDQSAARRNERTDQDESMETGSEAEAVQALEFLKKNPLVVSGETSKVLELDLPRGRYRVNWTAEGSGTLNVKHENASGSGYIVGESIPNPNHGERFVRIDETGRQIISVYAMGTVRSWELTFTPL